MKMGSAAKTKKNRFKLRTERSRTKTAGAIPNPIPCEYAGINVGVSAQAKMQQTKKRQPDDFLVRDCKQEATITEIIEPAPSQKIQWPKSMRAVYQS